ncbi:hypothetical protein QE82_23105 [Salmonella enterica subsp. enterica serovar Rubislaw]|nr:hypothetical protein [Salmonella enterica subsp. enterica serovar Rubislaw]
MTIREKFEAWWEVNYHNGNPPRFGWEAWRDGDGYKIDDDESELDGMWQAWQASRADIEITAPKFIDSREALSKGFTVDYSNGFGDGMDAYEENIRAVGVKVKE